MEKFLLSDVLSFFVRRNCVHQLLFVMNGFVVAHSLELCFAVGFAECMLVSGVVDRTTQGATGL